MGIDFVWNEAAAEDIRKECEAAMSQQAENMGKTRSAYITIAADLSKQAAAQEHIAATATTTDSEGQSVPDWPRRHEAAAKAADLREYEEALYNSRDRLYTAISNLEDNIDEWNERFYQLQDEVQQTDLHYAQQMRETQEEITDYIKNMEKVQSSFDSWFSFLFPERDVLALLNYGGENDIWKDYVEYQLWRNPDELSYAEYVALITIFENLDLVSCRNKNARKCRLNIVGKRR